MTPLSRKKENVTFKKNIVSCSSAEQPVSLFDPPIFHPIDKAEVHGQ